MQPQRSPAEVVVQPYHGSRYCLEYIKQQHTWRLSYLRHCFVPLLTTDDRDRNCPEERSQAPVSAGSGLVDLPNRNCGNVENIVAVKLHAMLSDL